MSVVTARHLELLREAAGMKAKRPGRFGEGYAVHAAPEAIAVRLASARRTAERAQREAAWLAELYELRLSQKERGLWPGPSGGEGTE